MYALHVDDGAALPRDRAALGEAPQDLGARALGRLGVEQLAQGVELGLLGVDLVDLGAVVAVGVV